MSEQETRIYRVILKERMKLSGLTVAALATAAGVSNQSVMDYRSGRGYPRPAARGRICQALGVVGEAHAEMMTAPRHEVEQ